jgi:polygalacturonase
MEGATLKGSDRIKDFPVVITRIEGETCKYFAALVNADGLDGFTISGCGTIDGNGLSYWQEFWTRRQWNPQCTNKDAQRPRLTYIANCQNVTVQDVHLINSPFWTNHIYKSHHVRYLDCYIYAPTENVFPPEPKRGAPSSDAIDVDACTDVLINGCFMHVNDDAVVMKGGKGTWADKDETNGSCERVLIQNCRYGRFLFIHPWTQFFKPGDRKDMPLSRCNNIVMRNNQVETKTMLDVKTSDKYVLEDFLLDGEQLFF